MIHLYVFQLILQTLKQTNYYINLNSFIIILEKIQKLSWATPYNFIKEQLFKRIYTHTHCISLFLLSINLSNPKPPPTTLMFSLCVYKVSFLLLYTNYIIQQLARIVYLEWNLYLMIRSYQYYFFLSLSNISIWIYACMRVERDWFF